MIRCAPTRRYQRRAGTCHNALPETERHDRIKIYQKTHRHSAWLACIHPQLEGKAPMSTGNLTRRAALAGASAVPLATIVASSTAASAGTAMSETGIDRAATSMLCRAAKGSPAARAIPGDLDPIFALIEEHRRVEAELNRVLVQQAVAERRFERETGVFSPAVECKVVYPPRYFGGAGETLEEVAANVRQLKGGTGISTARSHERIDEILHGDPGQAARCHALLDQLIAKHDRDIGPHERREEELGTASAAARDKIFAATATSTAGISALLAYAFGTDKKGRDNFDCAEDAWGFLEVIQRSFHELAAGQDSVQS
jgi:hypothetical protein